MPKESKVRHWKFLRATLVLCDHPEDYSKIQDKCKNTKFGVVWKHSEPNVYDINPVNGKGVVCTFNEQQFQDLKITQEEEGSNDSDTSKMG